MSGQINQNGKRLAVIGSRSCTDKDYVFRVLNKNKDKIKLIVSGGADGPDTFATDWATSHGIPYLVFPALWRDPFTGAVDMGAGFRRNRLIIQYCDQVLAFWDGVSNGTANSLTIAEQLNKPVKVLKFDPATMPKPAKPIKTRKKKEAQEKILYSTAEVSGAEVTQKEVTDEGTIDTPARPWASDKGWEEHDTL